MSHDFIAGHKVRLVSLGGVAASANGEVLRTILGSCISVCIRDPFTHIGGMNHFMLPNGDTNSGRYGVHAMELLINACMKLGADRRCFEAKVFGGGHVVGHKKSSNGVPTANIDFAVKFLDIEKIPVIKHDLGGFSAREVFFFTDSGRVLMRRLRSSSHDLRNRTVLDLAEIRARQAAAAAAAQDDENVTLF